MSQMLPCLEFVIRLLCTLTTTISFLVLYLIYTFKPTLLLYNETDLRIYPCVLLLAVISLAALFLAIHKRSIALLSLSIVCMALLLVLYVLSIQHLMNYLDKDQNCDNF